MILRRRDLDGEWKNQYRFSVQPHDYADYEEMCHFHQTSPQSHFIHGRTCTLATETGRITLSELRLITTEGPDKEERVLKDEEEYAALLRERFGILEQLYFDPDRV